MDFKIKGISWVGNVYQKFEAMCLEVEDAVCQETSKYVESQVQTVGSSVKKFYSEVMQDLLPPLDDKKTEGSGLFLEEIDSFGTYEKPKPSGDGNPAKGDSSTHDAPEITKSYEKNDKIGILKKSKACIEKYPINERLVPIEMSGEITSSGKIPSQASLRSRVHNKNSLLHSLAVNPGVAAHLKFPLKQNDSDVMSRKSLIPIGTAPLKPNPHLPEILESVAPAEKETSRASPVDSHPEEDHVKACDTHRKITCPMSFDDPMCNLYGQSGTSCSYRMAEIGRDSESPSSFHSSSLVPTVVSCKSKVVESNGVSASNHISTDESNGANTLVPFDALPLTGSSWHEPQQFSKEKSDDDELDDADGIVELPPEIIDEYQNAKLDESCIVVDSKELAFVADQPGKHISYKKKFRNALASRMRLAKKHDYEDLAIWTGDTTDRRRIESSSSSLLTKDFKKLPSNDIGESEWELL